MCLDHLFSTGKARLALCLPCPDRILQLTAAKVLFAVLGDCLKFSLVDRLRRRFVVAVIGSSSGTLHAAESRGDGRGIPPRNLCSWLLEVGDSRFSAWPRHASGVGEYVKNFGT
jgi:hypothetical protein